MNNIKVTPVHKKTYLNVYYTIKHDEILLIFARTTLSRTSTVSRCVVRPI